MRADSAQTELASARRATDTMLPKLDGRQRLRLRRLKMAMFSYAMWLSLAVFAYMSGNMDLSLSLIHI